MPSTDTIASWIAKLKQGNDEAAEAIWKEYFGKLVVLADQKLRAMPRQVADEEDVALSAMKSFVLAARQGRFPRLSDSDDLWKLLAIITVRKAFAYQRRHFASTRPDAQILEQAKGNDNAEWMNVEKMMDRDPTPELAAQFAEDFRRLLNQLPSDEFRQIAIWRMEGFTNREIADKLGWYEVKVERKLRIIRRRWSQEEEQ